jgi:hypothetical protein
MISVTRVNRGIQCRGIAKASALAIRMRSISLLVIFSAGPSNRELFEVH